MERIISDSLTFAGTTSEEVLPSLVHWAQQQSPPDYAMLCKDLKGQDFPVLLEQLYPTTNL